MSTIFTHPVIPLAIGLGLGRRIIPARLLIVGCVFSIVPDLDVIGFELGVSYYSSLGHRGFTHSIVFALCCSILAATGNRWFGVGFGKVFLFCAFAMISHGVVDALTYGGLGVEFAWPFNTGRSFFPWRPLPVSPIGSTYFFNHWGMLIFKAEVLRVWLPMLVFMSGLLAVRYIKFHKNNSRN